MQKKSPKIGSGELINPIGDSSKVSMEKSQTLPSGLDRGQEDSSSNSIISLDTILETDSQANPYHSDHGDMTKVMHSSSMLESLVQARDCKHEGKIIQLEAIIESQDQRIAELIIQNEQLTQVNSKLLSQRNLLKEEIDKYIHDYQSHGANSHKELNDLQRARYETLIEEEQLRFTGLKKENELLRGLLNQRNKELGEVENYKKQIRELQDKIKKLESQNGVKPKPLSSSVEKALNAYKQPVYLEYGDDKFWEISLIQRDGLYSTQVRVGFFIKDTKKENPQTVNTTYKSHSDPDAVVQYIKKHVDSKLQKGYKLKQGSLVVLR